MQEDRRSLLKKAAVGAGVVWVAPAVMSMPAMAASSVAPCTPASQLPLLVAPAFSSTTGTVGPPPVSFLDVTVAVCLTEQRTLRLTGGTGVNDGVAIDDILSISVNGGTPSYRNYYAGSHPNPVPNCIPGDGPIVDTYTNGNGPAITLGTFGPGSNTFRIRVFDCANPRGNSDLYIVAV